MNNFHNPGVASPRFSKKKRKLGLLIFPEEWEMVFLAETG